ncbi:MAG: L,D-transpeptidase [Halanaerobiales bacterium]
MANYHIYINLSARKLFLKENDIVIYAFQVAIGKTSTPTPSGNFKILSKAINPGGILGTRWMQFTRYQHGIHGTNQPCLIGQAVSLGCVRMYNQDVELLYNKVKIGTPLTIKYNLSKIKS